MRSPFFMYFSARSASWAPLLFQRMTRCHSVFSCFSPPCPDHCRLVANQRLATPEPLLHLPTSGSAPKLPISMTLFRLPLPTELPAIPRGGTKCDHTIRITRQSRHATYATSAEAMPP